VTLERLVVLLKVLKPRKLVCTSMSFLASRLSSHASRLTVHGDLFLAEDAEKQYIDRFELIAASCEKCSGDT
jgi:hypothetical protein